jgi:hypothetical protein
MSCPTKPRDGVSSRIRSDNVEGFLKLLETDFEILHERRGKDASELRLAR